MGLSIVPPTRFSPYAGIIADTGSAVCKASGPMSALATLQVGGVLQSNAHLKAATTFTAVGRAAFRAATKASATFTVVGNAAFRGHVLVTGAKSIVFSGGATAANSNYAAGFVRIMTAGSTKLTNSLIKSKRTPIFLTPFTNTAVNAYAFIKAVRHTAGSTIICLRLSNATTCTGRVWYHILPES